MRAIGTTTRMSVRIVMVIAALSFAGCVTQVPDVAPVDTGPRVVVDTPQPVKVPAPPRLPPVAIVLTSGQAAYADVAHELARFFVDHEKCSG